MNKLAIIGAGNFSTFALPQMMKNKNVQFVGILDTDVLKARQFQSKFGGIVFDDLDQLIANTIIPWTGSWLFFYELWLDTGKWLGPSSHDFYPQRK